MANSVLYGVMSQKDLAADLTPQNLAIEIDKDLLISAVLDTVEDHNTEINALRGIFAEDTTDYTAFFKGALVNMLQEGDEYANPLAVKGTAHYGIGLPCRVAQTKWGATYTSLNQMTLQEFSDRTDQMLIGDLNWHRKWIFGTLLFAGMSNPGGNPLTWVDPKFGPLSVYGLANGDVTLYEKNSSQAPATDTHYSAQSGAISDTSGQNPLPTIENALIEHAQNGGPYVVFVDPALVGSIRSLAGFVHLAREPAGYKAADTVATFDGTYDGPLPPNARVIGMYDQMWIIQWASIPAGHLIGVALGGPKVLKYRQFPQAALQGFAPVNLARGQFTGQFPYMSEVWYRAGGYGSWNRTGAYVHQVTASTTYSMAAAYLEQFGL